MLSRIAAILSPLIMLFAVASFGADAVSAEISEEPMTKAEIVDCAAVTPTAEVALIDYGFDPPVVKIPTGSVVKWVNKGDTSHIVKSGTPEEADAGSLFDTSFIIVRSSKCIRFLTPGTYTYFCRIHSKAMRDGKMIVEP